MLAVGIIAIWSGSLATIPAGWTLCDGTLGTPNLTSRFVRGASVGDPPGGSGGSGVHNHTFTSDGHFHTLPVGADVRDGDYWDRNTDTKTDSGTTDNGNSVPPYYFLAFIMRI